MGAAMGVKNGGVEYVIVLFDARTSRIAAFVDANSSPVSARPRPAGVATRLPMSFETKML